MSEATMSDAITAEATILEAVADGIATITLNRPALLNAVNLEMARALTDALRRAESDAAVRAIVLRGAGNHFMAGGDIKWFETRLDVTPAERRAAFEQLIEGVHAAITRLRRLPKPVIAAVHGAAAGFGLSLMASCDFVIAADSSTFTLAYTQLGTSPDGGSTFILPRLLGSRKAMELALLSDRFGGVEAAALGLINKAVARDQVDVEVATLARRLADGPTGAYGRTKLLINESFDRSLTEQLLAEQTAFAASANTADFAEGVRAFINKRKPAFTGN